VFKRCVDVLIAFFLLLLVCPILMLIAVLIKLDSEGPVLFRQTRIGVRFKPFEIVKLRTMQDHNHGSAVTLGADPRITRVGRWLRRSKFDEIPQLWNVLRGDMSIVGPRPVIPELAAEFHGAYEQLLRVRPGLTDPASLKYCHEAEVLQSVPDPLEYFKTVVIPDKLRISEHYLEHETLLSDLELVAKTARAILPHLSDLHLGHAIADRTSMVGTMKDPHSDENSGAFTSSKPVALLACADVDSDVGD